MERSFPWSTWWWYSKTSHRRRRWLPLRPSPSTQWHGRNHPYGKAWPDLAEPPRGFGHWPRAAAPPSPALPANRRARADAFEQLLAPKLNSVVRQVGVISQDHASHGTNRLSPPIGTRYCTRAAATAAAGFAFRRCPSVLPVSEGDLNYDGGNAVDGGESKGAGLVHSPAVAHAVGMCQIRSESDRSRPAIPVLC